jgi:hypothetical protein
MDTTQPTKPLELFHDAWGRLVLVDAEGRRHVGVEPIRAFPIEDPRHHLAVCDAEGHEVLWIDNLDELPQPIRAVLEEDLSRREFVPVVRRILRVSSATEPSEWEVETDRGPTTFVLNSDDDVRRLGNRRALILDAHGIRYLIPDVRALDGPSRRILERYM